MSIESTHAEPILSRHNLRPRLVENPLVRGGAIGGIVGLGLAEVVVPEAGNLLSKSHIGVPPSKPATEDLVLNANMIEAGIGAGLVFGLTIGGALIARSIKRSQTQPNHQ